MHSPVVLQVHLLFLELLQHLPQPPGVGVGGVRGADLGVVPHQVLRQVIDGVKLLFCPSLPPWSPFLQELSVPSLCEKLLQPRQQGRQQPLKQVRPRANETTGIIQQGLVTSYY